MNHDARIRDQFTRQAVPFSEAPSMRDEAAIALLVEAAAVGPGGRTLDVGCGPGLVALAFSQRVAHATGLDATPAMLDRARALQRERGRDNVGWQEGDAYRLPFPDAGFDAVTSRFAFHHLEEPARALAEMMRVTRPGGSVVVCDGVADADPAKAAAFNAWERLRDPSTVRFHGLEELRALLAGAGLVVRFERAYRVPAELEGLMRVSFPAEGDAARVRRILEDSAADDALGLGTVRRDGRVLFHYPAVVLAATVPEERP